MTLLRRLGVSTGPVMVAALAAHVFRGEPDAPLLLVLLVVAPLVALLARRDLLPWSPGLALLALPGVAVIACAHARVAVDIAEASGIAGPVALGVVAALLLVPAVAMRVERSAAVLLAGGVVTAAVAAVVLAATIGTPPWTAWRHVASRPALHFEERSGWLTGGRAVPAPTTLVFAEPHRVTAVAATTARVVQDDSGRPVVRERRLADGEALLMRPGDRLELERGARISFERGKRVPADPVSGVAWADPARRTTTGVALDMAGTALALLGGTRALVAPASGVAAGSAVVAPGIMLALGLAAATWGVYAIYAAPDLLVGASMVTPLVELPRIVSAMPVLPVLLGASVLMLFAAHAAAVGARVRHAVAFALRDSPRSAVAGRLVWGAVALGASVAAVWPADAWHLFTAGLGLLTVTCVAPALSGADRGPIVAGAVAGAAVLGVATIAAHVPGAWPVLGVPPVLVAAPLAWATAAILGKTARATPDARLMPRRAADTMSGHGE